MVIVPIVFQRKKKDKGENRKIPFQRQFNFNPSLPFLQHKWGLRSITAKNGRCRRPAGLGWQLPGRLQVAANAPVQHTFFFTLKDQGHQQMLASHPSFYLQGESLTYFQIFSRLLHMKQDTGPYKLFPYILIYFCIIPAWMIP